MSQASWGAMALLEGFLLLVGIAFRVGFDMPWRVALFPFYTPPAVVLLTRIGGLIAEQIHLYS